VTDDHIRIERETLDRLAMNVLIAATLSRDDHAIDIGAHRGGVLREILRVAPLGRHIAFEPLPDCCEYLRCEFPQVDVRNVALSDEDGETNFVHVVAAPEFSGMRQRAYPGYEDSPRRTLTVPMHRLDDALPAEFHPSLIKIDVEGAEMLVLRGAIETLRTHRPTVIFEHGIGASERYGYGSEDLHDLVCADLGMRIFDFDGQGPYSRQRFIDVFSEPMWNFVAVPG
jgi:FkbM family methyltransferase